MGKPSPEFHLGSESYRQGSPQEQSDLRVGQHEFGSCSNGRIDQLLAANRLKKKTRVSKLMQDTQLNDPKRLMHLPTGFVCSKLTPVLGARP